MLNALHATQYLQRTICGTHVVLCANADDLFSNADLKNSEADFQSAGRCHN